MAQRPSNCDFADGALVAVGYLPHALDQRHPVVTGAIVGARNTRQAEGVVRARELHLNEIEAFAETAA